MATFRTPAKISKRAHGEISPNAVSPPLKIIKRSPKERRDEIRDTVELLICPIQRELAETNRKLEETRLELEDVREIKEEMRKELLQLEDLKGSIIDTVKVELHYKIGQVDRVKKDLESVENLKAELTKVKIENDKLKEQQRKQEKHNRRSNVHCKKYFQYLLKKNK